jgi:hypothetical protein
MGWASFWAIFFTNSSGHSVSYVFVWMKGWLGRRQEKDGFKLQNKSQKKQFLL